MLTLNHRLISLEPKRLVGKLWRFALIMDCQFALYIEFGRYGIIVQSQTDHFGDSYFGNA